MVPVYNSFYERTLSGELLLEGVPTVGTMPQEDQVTQQAVAAGRLRRFYPFSYAVVDEVNFIIIRNGNLYAL